MRNKPYKVALVGCGAVSEMIYAPLLARLVQERLVEIVAIVDPNSDRTEKIKKVFMTSRSYQNISSLFDEDFPDLAIIASPHKFHADQTVACLDRGIHVLCEKPMATTSTDCDRMTDAAAKVGCVLAVGHFRRFFPSCELIKEILDAGLLGPIESFRFLEGETFSWPAQSGAFFNRTESGGGVLIDSGAHTLDLLLWWMGEVAEVEYHDDALGGIEANCRMRLKMVNGAEGIVQLSRDWPLPNRYVIECKKGWLAYTCDVVDRLEWGLCKSAYGLNAHIQQILASGRDARLLGASVRSFTESFMAQLRNVVASISGSESPRVPGTEAKKCVTLIEQCYQRRQLLDMPWLSEKEYKHARKLANV